MPNTNGPERASTNGRSWVTWVLGIASTLLVATVLALGSTVIEHGQRLAGQEVSITESQKRLERIETKLDTLLTRSGFPVAAQKTGD